LGRIDSDTLYGTLKVLILKTLSAEPLHGLAIARSIGETSDEFLKVEEGALYPALHRLERAGLLRSTWGASDNNRRAKFYALTHKGRRHLDREVRSWARHAGAVAKVLDVRPSAG
jgi:transcriptional regulator